MVRLKVHVLYEHGADGQPFGAAQIRLLRPLSHPTVQDSVEMTAGLDYAGEPVDAVIVDRLWRPDLSPEMVEQVAATARRAGARLIHSIDDNLLDLGAENKDWRPSADQLRALSFLLTHADGIVVATSALRDRLTDFNPSIVVVPNALDERLISSGDEPREAASATTAQGPAKLRGFVSKALRRSPAQLASADRIVIGYMGTHTHDDDLLMVLPALRQAWRRRRSTIEIQLIGVVAHQQTRKLLGEMQVRFVAPPPGCSDYLRFMPWFTGHVRWDIAIAPLLDTPFSRCKSDIKFLDYGALGTAGIYSRVPAYQSTVKHLHTGWLVENDLNDWIEALEALISNADLRLRLGGNAGSYLRSERVLARSASNWSDALRTLVA